MKKILFDFLKSYVICFVMGLPYWVAISAIVLICAFFDNRLFNGIALFVFTYAALGTFIVFVLLKEKSNQLIGKLDFVGALKNIYVSFWWPWYLIYKVEDKGR